MTVGICSFAHQLPGPPAKVYSRTPTHRKTGACLHEAEYDLPEDDKVLYNVLFSKRLASWHFTITREGWLFQHYPLDATCWHCGWPGNLWLVGIELETTGNRELTVPQHKVLVRLLRWLHQELDWGWPNLGVYGIPHHGGPTIWEHNEAQKPYTDCQVFSQGIIDVVCLLVDLRREDDMAFTDEDRKMLKDIMAVLEEVLDRLRKPLIRKKGFPEIYEVVVDQGLVHLVDIGFFNALRYRWGDVRGLGVRDTIWKVPVKFLGGVPR